jgi:hypothetical protein
MNSHLQKHTHTQNACKRTNNRMKTDNKLLLNFQIYEILLDFIVKVYL